MKRWVSWVFVGLVGCSGTPRPFGVESASVHLVAGDVAAVGFRVNLAADGGAPGLSVSPDDGGVEASFGSVVFDDGALAGTLQVTSSSLSSGGEATVQLGSEKIHVVVTSPPAVRLDGREQRRSTVAISSGVISALADDGNVYTTLATAVSVGCRTARRPKRSVSMGHRVLPESASIQTRSTCAATNTTWFN